MTREEIENLAERCAGEWNDWMRQPDWAENFSLADMLRLVNARPAGSFVNLAATLRALTARADAAEAREVELQDAINQAGEAIIERNDRLRVAGAERDEARADAARRFEDLNGMMGRAEDAMVEAELLRETLTLAANRLVRCLFGYNSGTTAAYIMAEWTQEARAALTGENP